MSDHLFPRYHVRPARGYLNDPNGPIVVDGCSHLYFQYRHTVDLDAPVEWAHVTSDDLVHWRYHRPAMAPHPFGDDRDGCWSGNTVVDASGNVRAFYSGFVADEPLQRTRGLRLKARARAARKRYGTGTRNPRSHRIQPIPVLGGLGAMRL